MKQTRVDREWSNGRQQEALSARLFLAIAIAAVAAAAAYYQGAGVQGRRKVGPQPGPVHGVPIAQARWPEPCQHCW